MFTLKFLVDVFPAKTEIQAVVVQASCLQPILMGLNGNSRG